MNMQLMMARARINHTAIGAHRWWRIYVTQVESSSTGVCSIAELQFRSMAGGPSLAGGSPSANTTYTTVAGYDASKAFDSNPGTFWGAADYPPSGLNILSFKLTAAANVRELAVQVRAGNTFGQGPKNFTVQSSVDSINGQNGTWDNIWSVTGQTGWSSNETRIFTRP